MLPKRPLTVFLFCFAAVAVGLAVTFILDRVGLALVGLLSVLLGVLVLSFVFARPGRARGWIAGYAGVVVALSIVMAVRTPSYANMALGVAVWYAGVPYLIGGGLARLVLRLRGGRARG